jgi:hypothetical protein
MGVLERFSMNFIQHFNSLKIPLKETSKVFKSLFESIADSFNALHGYFIELLGKHFISNNSSVRLFAEERGIERIKGESDISFRKRVLNAYHFLKSSPTRQGIEAIIQSSIAKEFEIRELYQENFVLGNPQEKLGISTILQSSLASYYFVLDFSQPLTVEEKSYLKEIIELYKPAHIGYHINAMILDDWILGKDGEFLGENTYL